MNNNRTDKNIPVQTILKLWQEKTIIDNKSQFDLVVLEISDKLDALQLINDISIQLHNSIQLDPFKPIKLRLSGTLHTEE